MIKCATACLVALALLGVLCDAQSYGKPQGSQHSQKPRDPPQRQKPHHSDQSKQTFEIFTWTYPSQEEEPTSPQVDVELKEPDPAETVTAICGETTAVVTVMKDLFNNGQIISASDLKLGACGSIREDATSVVFEPELHKCESVSEVSAVKKIKNKNIDLNLFMNEREGITFFFYPC